jgi:murein DD-endopeptidase MepM/ murein hydrolase activator NlpD
VVPISGRLNGGERFAVDWFKWDPTVDRASLAAGLLPTFHGDPTSNEDYLAYGQPLLAVADGTIVAVVSDTPDSVPHVLPTGLAINEYGGNVVTVDIGNGVYASYAHLAPGSATVKVGDEVTRGQVIGRLGNSGNSTEAHLHFQLQRTPALLSGDNVPFEIDNLTYVASLDNLLAHTPSPNAGARANQMPLFLSVVAFPAAP